MTQRKISIPVIDLFAGPGGLSEGFSRFSAFTGSDVDFRIRLSIEKDEVAWRTLRLRSFVRQFPEGELPEEYYTYLRSARTDKHEKALTDLMQLPEWQAAEQEAWLAELGEVVFDKLHERISDALNDARDWVLLGGPPCQVYSKVGRARLLGPGQEIRQLDDDKERQNKQKKKSKVFYGDVRHNLYREYLKVVAIHQPAIFVMENVSGILSAKAPVENGNRESGRSEYVFDHILRDLKDPWAALEDEGLDGDWWRFGSGTSNSYRIHSFVMPPDLIGENYRADYQIKSEKFGVPQARNRVILFGIRDDIDVIPSVLKKSRKPVSLKDVIGNLPLLRSGRSRGAGDSSSEWLQAIRDQVTDEILESVDDEKIRERMRSIRDRKKTNLTRGGLFLENRGRVIRGNEKLARWIKDPKLEGVYQHEARTHMDSDFARYLFVSVYGEIKGKSPKLRNFPEVLLPSHESVHKIGKDGKKQLSRHFPDRFRVQVAGSPAGTIVSHIRRDGHYYIHYDPKQCRSLTVREAARIQTFPDNYFFEGNRTEQYQQVGNAVPPYLALQLAGVIAGLIKALNATDEPEDRQVRAASVPLAPAP